MESANFIPLGSVKGRLPFDQPEKCERPPAVQGSTKDERKRIAREVRLAARKEKKKSKSDAKKQRKENAILNRRMTRNNEKYSKNKDRNHQRAIDLERSKIRNEAVRQAERLAAKYDLSGKMFNVGEVVVLEDGSVKSKERIRKNEELRIQKQKEKKATEEAKKAAEELKRSRKAARQRDEDPDTAMEGVNSERLALIKPPKRISNTQKKKLEMYAPKPVPPKPVIPREISLPEGEENIIALWDITDEEIIRRLNDVKKKKGQERIELKKQQKKEKVFRRAMKTKKKQAINRGEDFDPEKAAEEILEEKKKSKFKNKTKPMSDSESDWDSDSDSDSDSSSDSDSGSETEVKKTQAKAETAEAKSEPQMKSKSKKRSNSEVSNGENKPEDLDVPKPKKSKKSKHSSSEDVKTDKASEAAETGEASNEKIKEMVLKPTSAYHHDPNPTPEAIKKIVQKEKQRVKKSKKREEKLAKAIEGAEKLQDKPKKRKRSQEEVGPTDNAKLDKPLKKKKVKTEKAQVEKPEVQVEELAAAPTEHTNTAEQWNPDALTGDEARKAKFLRLLGAGKSNGDISSSSSKRKSHTNSSAISTVQSELERQYEASVKLKHGGGSKRRGIGA